MQITHMTRCEQVVESNRKFYILCVEACVPAFKRRLFYLMTAWHGI